MTKSQLAFAFDFPTLEAAIPYMIRLRNYVGVAKIGLELFTREGPSAVTEAIYFGYDVMLDLKLHDIPQTVEGAVANACSLDVKFLTLHIAGGGAMIERAVARARSENTGLQLVGVTVLTSLDTSDLRSLGVKSNVEDHVLELARLGWSAGLGAFVCSPKEASAIRNELPKALLITPGVRLAAKENELQDQKRVESPYYAILTGANILVVGREIRNSSKPEEVALRVGRQIEQANTDLLEYRK